MQNYWIEQCMEDNDGMYDEEKLLQKLVVLQDKQEMDFKTSAKEIHTLLDKLKKNSHERTVITCKRKRTKNVSEKEEEPSGKKIERTIHEVVEEEEYTPSFPEQDIL